MVNVSDKPDVLSAGQFFLYMEQRAVLAADSDGFHSQGLDHRHQLFVDFVQHHLRNFHGRRIGHPQPVDEFRLHAYFSYPTADLFSSAVNDDRFEAYQFQQYHVLDHVPFQFFVHHRASAVLDDNHLPVEPLNIRQCLDQNFRFVQIHFIYHFLLSSKTAFLITIHTFTVTNGMPFYDR